MFIFYRLALIGRADGASSKLSWVILLVVQNC